MSSPLFSIAIDVEESALGNVLRLLNRTPGVAKFHLDLDTLSKKSVPKNGAGPGSGKYERDKDGPSNKDIVILALVDGPKNLEFLRSINQCKDDDVLVARAIFIALILPGATRT